MKKLFTTFLLGFFSIIAFAQEFQVPENYKFETADDYAPYEEDILRCIDWLMQSPVSFQPDKRKEATAFLLKWLMGSPYVHIEIKPEIVSFAGTSPDLLMIFLGGWAKKSIETKAYEDKIAGSLAGLESVIEFYIKNKGALPKDKNVEKYVKMKQKGTLREYFEMNA